MVRKYPAASRVTQRGSALLNVALGLVVGLSVIAAAWAVGASAIQKARMEKSVQIIETVRDGIFSSYRTRQSYSGLNSAALYDMGVIDRNLFKSDRTIAIPYGRNLQAAAANYTSLCANTGRSCDDGFYVELTNIQEHACQELYLTKFGDRHHLTRVLTVGGSIMSSSYGLPSPAAAQIACDRDYSRIQFYFY